MRYVGQSYEITVQAQGPNECLNLFHQLHAARYAHSHADRAVEVVTARVKAIGRAQVIERHAQPPGDPDASLALAGEEEVWFEGGALKTSIYDRERLRAGHRIQGPAAIFQLDTTTIVPPRWTVNVDSFNNLIVSD
jgi:N-methylhydantoinase A